MQLIDRRLNPKGKSLANRQRFIRRAKASIREAVQKQLHDGKVTDFIGEKKISIPTKTTQEPRFRLDPKTGEQNWVAPGNKTFTEGDRIKKPQQGDGQGAGKDAAPDGELEDSFEFTLTRDELLDVLFDDLELPNLVKTTLKDTPVVSFRRAGYTTAGSPTNIALLRTMRRALGRRIALSRPKQAELDALAARIETESDEDVRARLTAELEALTARRRRIGFIDPIDVRYNAFEARPEPAARAVMFCLMDVSGSMGEREKDLAKRFYMLLHLFLRRRYERLDVVFIRHTHEAQEVDEQEFFYSRMSGGTVVSSALEVMLDIIAKRYASAEWNIYVAQASDGYTQSGDAQACVSMLHERVMPVVQHYAYIEILDEREMNIFASEEAGAELWRAYRGVSAAWRNFDAKRIAKPSDIYPVFRDLFAKETA